LPINFIKPREPKPAKDPNQRKLAFGAALAASLLLGGVVYCYMQLSALGRDIGKQMVENAKATEMLSTLEEDAKKFKALNDWDRKGVVFLDELYDVTEKFPDPSTLQLTSLVATPRDDAKDKKVARIKLEGIMRGDAKNVNRLIDLLGQDAHRRPDAMATNPNSGPLRFQGWNQKFTVPVDVEKPLPTKYTSRLPDIVREGGDQ